MKYRSCFILSTLLILFSLSIYPMASACEPLLRVTYSPSPAGIDCAEVYGSGTLSVTNTGSLSIYDVNLGCGGDAVYYRMDGSPLFPIHFNEILPGATASVPFLFSMTSSDPVTISDSVVYLPPVQSPDDSIWDSVCPDFPSWQTGATSPGILITVRNSGTASVTIATFTKPPASNAAYSFVKSTSGEACIEYGSVIVRNVVVPAGGTAQILIGLSPYCIGVINLPDASFSFKGDPLDFVDCIHATAISDAGIDVAKVPSGSAYQVSISFRNRGVTTYLLESAAIRQGITFSPNDRTVARWEPMLVLSPGETWDSPAIADQPGIENPAYNAVTVFTLIFSRESNDLTLGARGPSVPAIVPVTPVSPAIVAPVVYPIWDMTPVATPVIIIGPPGGMIGGMTGGVTNQTSPDNVPVDSATGHVPGAATEMTVVNEICLRLSLFLLAAILVARLVYRYMKKV